MKKVKLDFKAEKSADAFAGAQNPDENALSSLFNGANLSELEKESVSATERQSLKNLLKQIFLFLPGTTLLFFMSYGAAIIFVEIVVYRRDFETLPDDFPFQFALIGLIILLGIFMTWFGLGDIKNKKHFAIPASIIVTGAFFGAIIKAAASVFDLADKMLDDFSYLIYLLPIALIVPILAKSIVGRPKTESIIK